MTAPTSFSADTIDRVTPTRRPLDRVAMRQSWHHLLFLHWVVPVEALRPLVPHEVEIDTFEGRAYIGLVPFTMTGVRPIWAPAFPPLSNFHEVNVRTYVHYQGADPGVWFFSLDAANSVAVRLARTIWKLPYHFARMELNHSDGLVGELRSAPESVRQSPSPNTIDYQSERLWPPPVPAACSVRYTPAGPITPAAVGSLEHFLAERYLLYTTAGGRLFRGQVNHTPYPLQAADVHSLEESLVAAAGIAHGSERPLAHYARVVHVEIFPLRPALTQSR